MLLFAVAPLVLVDFRLSLLGKYLCYAIVASGIGLAWGRGGMLVLGQGVFFGLGAYMMAMHLKIADARAPPRQRAGFHADRGYTCAARLLGAVRRPRPSHCWRSWWCPTAIAAALGLGVFKRRVKGAYFAILSQALAAALAILLVGQASLGGSNGLNRFRSFFGFALNDPANRRMLYFIAAGVLLLVVAVVRQLMQSRYGELLVAVRDGEERVRFLGYDPANIKVVAYTAAALFASIAGALFAPIVGFIAPSQVGIVPSIAFLIGVAIGGRTTLFGPGTRRDRRGMGADAVLRAIPVRVDLRARPVVHRRVGFFPAGLAGWGALLRRWRKPKPATATAEAESKPEPERVPVVMTAVEPLAGGNAGMGVSTSKCGALPSISTASRPSATSISPSSRAICGS